MATPVPEILAKARRMKEKGVTPAAILEEVAGFVERGVWDASIIDLVKTRLDETPDPRPLPARVQNARVPVFYAPTPVQHEAMRLYGLGLNVFPQQFGKKAGFDWKRLQYTRLYFDGEPRAYDLLDVFSGRCNFAVMTGRTSGNLFIIDCETRASFEYHVGQMRTRRLPLWVAQSPSRKGGGHIYLRCAEGEVANIAPGTLMDAEVRANRCYVLVPPSVHPSGGQYQWAQCDGDAPPVVELDLIDWLTDHDGNPVSLKLANTRRTDHLSRPFTPLSRKTQEYLAGGRTFPEGMRNTRLFSAACDYHGNGFSIERARHDLAPVAATSGLDEAEITETIAKAYSKYREPSRKPGRRRYFDWQLATAFSQSNNWAGRKGATERAVFNALVERARVGSGENGAFRASCREIAELARVTKDTASKTMRRLQSSTPPLLCYAIPQGVRDSTEQARSASLYRFSKDVLQRGREALVAGEMTTNDTLVLNQNRVSSSVLNIVTSSDAAERGALGAHGMHVYQVLLTFDIPAQPKAIADRAKLTTRQVRYCLGKLITFGLVERRGRTYIAYPATEKQLDDIVARAAGTFGKGEKRRRLHAKERALYAGRALLKSRYKRDRANLAYRPDDDESTQLNGEVNGEYDG